MPSNKKLRIGAIVRIMIDKHRYAMYYDDFHNCIGRISGMNMDSAFPYAVKIIGGTNINETALLKKSELTILSEDEAMAWLI